MARLLKPAHVQHQIRHVVKHALIVLLKISGMLRLSRWISTRRGFMVIGWHGVSLDDEHRRFASLFIAPATFRKRLEFLRRAFKVISLDEALQQHKAGHIADRQVVLTFDDGYYNFLAKAVPILSQYRLPATVYVVSLPMSEGRPFHNLILRDCVLRTSASWISVGDPGCFRRFPLRSVRDKQAAIRALNVELGKLRPTDADSYVDGIAKRLRVDLPLVRAKRHWSSLSNEEVARVARLSGMSVQLHSHRHINVLTLGSALSEDLEKCKAAVEAASGKTADHFCYPTGFWSKAAWSALEEAGIKSAVTGKRGPNFSETPVYALRRVMDGEHKSQLEFEFEVSNIKWLVHTIWRRRNRYCPDEKHHRYAVNPAPY